MTTIRTQVAAGDLEGELNNGLAVFKGIPPTRPSARFAAPTRPGLGWNPPGAVLRAAHLQAGGLGPSAQTGDEADWLTANIWSPDLTGALPVLVWIHGAATSSAAPICRV